MNKPSLKAYLDLIQGLLSCPQGEEWILLRQHGELVNLGLVEVMEQVANYFTIEGKTKPAKFLHNWASQLHHILLDNIPSPDNQDDKTHAYLELIQSLLDCPEGLEQQILTAHQDLINPELIKVMQEVSDRLMPNDSETADYLNNLAAELNRTWLKHHEFEPTFKPEIAPDPWLEEPEPVPVLDRAIAETPEQSEEIAKQQSKITAPLSSPGSIANEYLFKLLTKIAESLDKLEATIATKQVANTLWYMEVLEKAAAAKWILTTEEVEQLIGVKPHCHHDETDYHRGNWVFIKAGKVGAQLGWRVSKQDS